MTDLYALKQELDNGHPITGPYSTNSKAAAEEINVDNRTHLIPLSSNELLAWAAKKSDGDRPRRIKIREGINSANEDIEAICLTAESIIAKEGSELDLNLTDRAEMVAALVQAGVLSQADSDSLYALATQAISRATEIGLSNVRAGTVEQARALTQQQGAT